MGYINSKKFVLGVVTLWMCSVAQFGYAVAITTQTIVLQPGWNAVHLELEPDDGVSGTDTDELPSTVFHFPEIDMVWALPSAKNVIQYIEDPDEIGIDDPGWRVYIPAHKPTSGLTNLHSVSAGQVYLIKFTGQQAKNLVVSGKPRFRSIAWQPESFNLVGFFADPDPLQQVSFSDFLSLPNDSNPPIYRLQNNSWQLINKNAIVEHGVGYWVYNDGLISTSGPLAVNQTVQNGLGFGQLNSVKQFQIKNLSNNALNDVTFLVQDFPLHRFDGFDDASGNPQWPSMHGHVVTLNENEKRDLLLGVERSALVADQQGLLSIRGGGMQLHIPLSAEAIEQNDHGLWIGTAVINAVNNVNADDPLAPEPVRSPLSMKLIVHSGESGVHLLKQVYMLGDFNIPDQEGGAATVLITQDEMLPNYTPLALSLGENVGYRISSSAYDYLSHKQLLSGTLSSSLQGQIVIAPELSTHPLSHQWHPDHDNLTPTFTPIPPSTPQNPVSSFIEEVWTVTRDITFTTNETVAPSTDTSMGRIYGEYEEVITGMHKLPIVMRGVFNLTRISLVSELDPDQ